MSEVIKVWVAKFGDRAHYQLQWRDPITSRLRTKSTRIRRSGLARDRKVAERMAGELEVKLNAGEAVIPSRFLWQDFRARYEAEVVPGLAPRTGEKISSVFDRFEADINPRRLWDVDEKRLSAFVSNLRKGEGGRGKLAESTIAGHLAHLKAALNWAKLQKLIAHLPGFPRIKRAKMSKGAKVMRGRPITTEEFERMLGKVEDVVGQAAVADGAGVRPTARQSAGTRTDRPGFQTGTGRRQAWQTCGRSGVEDRQQHRREGEGARGCEENRVGARPSACLRRALGLQVDARPADGIDAARDDRDDPLLLRGPQCREDRRHPLA